MRYLLVVLMVAVAVPALAQKKAAKSTSAASGEISPNQGSDSCGLGWQVTQEKTLIATTTRGTTNSVVSPAFGMTTGSIGCEQHGFAKKEIDSAIYAAVNFDTLSIDMASGSGEVLEGFAATLGCTDSAKLGQALRANYRTVAPAANGIEMYKNIRQVIRSDKSLSGSCPNAA